jgi:hypothetical protein
MSSREAFLRSLVTRSDPPAVGAPGAEEATPSGMSQHDRNLALGR